MRTRELDLFEKQKPRSKRSTASDRECLERRFAPFLREELTLGKLVSYAGNKAVPLLRLYRYKEAFAFGFVEQTVSRFGLGKDDYLFDPFCGMGTALLVASQEGIGSIGIDRLPIAVFVSRTLPLFYQLRPGRIRATFERLKPCLRQVRPAPVAMDVAIMKVAFPTETLLCLRKWKALIDDLEGSIRDVFLLLFFSVLESCSYTSKDGQFLRLNRKKRTAAPEDALERVVNDAERDVELARSLGWNQGCRLPSVYEGDARDLSGMRFPQPPTAIITSPPYANRYDYTRTYSLELCFHFVRNFAELKALRQAALRSHIESRVHSREKPPHPAVQEVVELLREKPLNNPRIPDMLIGYFVDMQEVIKEWSRILAPGAKVAMVVDNVRFEGEMIPVDLILSDMAEQSGFGVREILIARYKGNSSQQMGKYGRSPVRESIVIWRKH